MQLVTAPTQQLHRLEARYRELAASYSGVVEWQWLAIATLGAIVAIQGELVRLEIAANKLEIVASKKLDGRPALLRACLDQLRRLESLRILVELKLTEL